MGSRVRALREHPAGAQAADVLLDPAPRLDAWASAREAHSQTLTAAEDPECERELRQELAELEAREKLVGRLDAVKEGMTRCSQFVHDEPQAQARAFPGGRSSPPTSPKLQEFERQTRS
jgi:hypothetical protein